MTIATNPETGEVVVLDDQGQWKKARTAIDPQTKEMLAFDGKSWAKVPMEQKGLLRYVDDAVRSLASGVTFGFADELAAKADELTGRGGSYESNLAREQARDKQIPAAIKIPGEIAGAVGSAVAAAPVVGATAAATGLSRLPAMARFAGVGGAGGAAFGAGEAEPGLANRLTGALKGAAIGTPLGIAAPYVVGGVVKAGNALRSALMPETGAAKDLGRALSRDNMTPAQLLERHAQLSVDRPGVATLADAGGENVKGLVERVAQTPGAGRTTVVPTLTQRQQGQLGRVANDLKGLTGTRQTAMQAVEDTIAERSKAARPLYDEAFQFDLGQSLEFVNAFRKEISTGWGKSVIDSPELRKTLQTEYGITGSIDDTRLLMPIVDAWKKQVDDMISKAREKEGGKNLARVLEGMLDRVIPVVDKVNPKYAEARQAWAGPSRFLDAVKDGAEILSPKLGADELTARFASPRMTDAEKEGFRVGAVSAMIARMGSDAAKLGDMTKYLRSPEMRNKIAAMMPSKEAAESWMKRLEFEVGSSELTGRALGNSATYRRQAERADADGVVGDLVLDLMTGGTPTSLWRKVVSHLPKKMGDTLRSRSDSRLADVLTQVKDDGALRAFLERAAGVNATPSGTANAATILGTETLAVP